MVSLFREPDGDDAGELGMLLDPAGRPGGRDVLDVAVDTPPGVVLAAAEELLSAGRVDRLDLSVDGRPVGVVTLPSLLSVRVTARGEVRGRDDGLPGAAAVRPRRPPAVRLVCATCGATVHLLCRPLEGTRCPAGHPLGAR